MTLALHGWTPDHRLMLGCLEPVFARRTGYRRLYPDLPAMGRSPAPESIASGGYLARALVASRAEQVLGLALICPVGTALEHADRSVPGRQVLRPDPELLASVDPRVAEDFAGISVVQTPPTPMRWLASGSVGGWPWTHPRTASSTTDPR